MHVLQTEIINEYGYSAGKINFKTCTDLMSLGSGLLMVLHWWIQ